MSTQTMDVAAWLDGLEEARKAATPGPWEATGPRADGGAYIDTRQVRLDDGSAPWIGRAHRQPDAALIVAAVNALPELVAALRGVLALAEEFAQTHGATEAYCADRIRAAVAAAHTEEGR
jgi:hypothetical protein